MKLINRYYQVSRFNQSMINYHHCVLLHTIKSIQIHCVMHDDNVSCIMGWYLAACIYIMSLNVNSPKFLI